jgi:hypothetical protein
MDLQPFVDRLSWSFGLAEDLDSALLEQIRSHLSERRVEALESSLAWLDDACLAGSDEPAVTAKLDDGLGVVIPKRESEMRGPFRRSASIYQNKPIGRPLVHRTRFLLVRGSCGPIRETPKRLEYIQPAIGLAA